MGGRWQEVTGRLGREVGIPVTIGIVGLTALSIAAGLVLTKAGIGRGLVEADGSFARQLVDGRTPTLDRLTGATTVLADTFTVAVLWAGAIAVAAWRTRSWRIPLFLLAAIGGEKLTYLITSLVVGRPRPAVPPLGHVFATKSFPSGHVGAAIALYGGLVLASIAWPGVQRPGRRLAVGLPVVAAIAGVVAFSRMYRGHHYLSDVVWGALLGVVWLAIARRVVLAQPEPAPDAGS